MRGWIPAGLAFFSLHVSAMDFKAGAHVESLSPPEGVSLAGFGGGSRRNFFGPRTRYAHYLKPSKGLHDEVKAKALVMEFGGQKIALVSVDLVAASASMREELGRRLTDIGITEEQLFLAATHTHSGPAGFSEIFFWQLVAADKFVPEIWGGFVDAIERAVRSADAHRRSAVLAIGQRGFEGLVRNRRKSSELDPELTLIRVDGEDGRSIASVLNFPMHPTAMNSKNLHVTADIVGTIEGHFSALTDGVAMFVNGAEGDVSPSRVKSDFKDLDRAGSEIAQKFHSFWSELKPSAPSSFRMVHLNESLDWPVLNIFACVNKNSWSGKWLLPIPLPLTREAKFSGFVIDQHVFVAVPGEPITRLGTMMKEQGRRAGFQTTSIFGLTNDHLGYILTEEEYQRGGYESCGSLYGPGLGEKVLTGTGRVLRNLKRIEK